MTDSTVPMPSTLEDFAIEGLLGEGGSATVFAARREGREIALKVLRADPALSDEERGSFLEQAGRMRRVDHPALVALVDSGILADGRPYLAMPRLRGEPLSSRLMQGPVPLEEALALFGSLADAVAALHGAGLVHGDIKPSSVFVDGTDPGVTPKVTLLEFGIRGTPAFMAPERLLGRPASVSSDVYELAGLLYAMLSGELPSGIEPIASGETGLPLPRRLAAALFHGMSSAPDKRPASARALAAEVRDAIAARDSATHLVADPEALPEPSLVGERSEDEDDDSSGELPVGPGQRAAWTEPKRRGGRRWAIGAIGASLLAAVVGGAAAMGISSATSRSTWRSTSTSTPPSSAPGRAWVRRAPCRGHG